MRFMFWNIKRNAIGEMLSSLANAHAIDVMILAECSDRAAILQSLNAETENMFHLTDSDVTRVVVYTRFPTECITSEFNDPYMTIRKLSVPGHKEILLAAVHFLSKLHNGHSQRSMSIRLAEEICKVEERIGHSRTILVGDLNMNPFEPGMTSADGFHAVMTRQIAAKKGRTVRNRRYQYFYNPMWGCFGDNADGPPGTFYKTPSEFVEYFWHMFDQVLIRPDLVDAFDCKYLKILPRCSAGSFLGRSGIPDSSRVSDHLPLLFELRI